MGFQGLGLQGTGSDRKQISDCQWVGGECDNKRAAWGSVGRDGTLLYPDYYGSYVKLYAY